MYVYVLFIFQFSFLIKVFLFYFSIYSLQFFPLSLSHPSLFVGFVVVVFFI